MTDKDYIEKLSSIVDSRGYVIKGTLSWLDDNINNSRQRLQCNFWRTDKEELARAKALIEVYEYMHYLLNKFKGEI